MAQAGRFERLQQVVTAVAHGREVAANPAEVAHPRLAAEAPANLLMNWNRGAVRRLRFVGFPGAVPAPDKRLSPYRGAPCRSLPSWSKVASVYP